MKARSGPLLAAACLLASLHPSVAAAEFRYLTVGDVRQSFNSHVYDLDLAVDPSENRGLVTEVEPGIRFYLGQRRSLLSLRYSFLGQLILIMRKPVEEVTGYGNRLQLNYTYRASRRTELGIMNLFEQGTENVTAPPTINANGVPMAARMVTAGRVVTEALRVGVAHQLASRWTVRPLFVGEIYYPYGDPPSEDIPTGNPIYSLGMSVRLAWGWFQRSALILEVNGSALFDSPNPTDFLPDRIEGGQVVSFQNERNALPDHWRTLLGGGTLAWRWQFTDFLDAEIGAGAQYFTRQYFCDISQNPACPPTLVDYEGGVAPVVDGFVRYRYGGRISVSVGYAHGWERQTEITASAAAETDRAGINVHYALKDWLFEGLGAFVYQRTETRGMENAIDGALPDASKSLTGQIAASYRVRPGLSVGASYRIDALMDRSMTLIPITEEQAMGIEPPPPNCSLNGNRANCILYPNDVIRHVVTVGVSVAWPPPPPQEVRLTRRESEYEPVFFLGGAGGGGGGGGATRVAGDALPNTRDRRRQRPAWMGGVEMPEPPRPASIIPPEETPEEPPMPDRGEEQEQDDGYYSWPR